VFGSLKSERGFDLRRFGGDLGLGFRFFGGLLGGSGTVTAPGEGRWGGLVDAMRRGGDVTLSSPILACFVSALAFFSFFLFPLSSVRI